MNLVLAPLSQESPLIVIAEIGIALAGFSSIVIALRRGTDQITSFAYIRLWRLLETSLATVLFALVPFALHYLGVGKLELWRAASGALCTYVVCAQLYMFIHWWEQWKYPAIPWWFNGPVLVVQFSVVVMLALNATAVGLNGEFGPYFVALLWYLTLSALYFGRLLLLHRQGDEDLPP
ncbi:MAG: hypothetical protein AAEJ52_10805 [Myxococcota bacterium]